MFVSCFYKKKFNSQFGFSKNLEKLLVRMNNNLKDRGSNPRKTKRF